MTQDDIKEKRFDEFVRRYNAGEDHRDILRAMSLSGVTYSEMLNEAEAKGLVERRNKPAKPAEKPESKPQSIAVKAWDDLKSLSDDELRRLYNALNSEAAARFLGRAS